MTLRELLFELENLAEESGTLDLPVETMTGEVRSAMQVYVFRDKSGNGILREVILLTEKKDESRTTKSGS